CATAFPPVGRGITWSIVQTWKPPISRSATGALATRWPTRTMTLPPRLGRIGNGSSRTRTGRHTECGRARKPPSRNRTTATFGLLTVATLSRRQPQRRLVRRKTDMRPSPPVRNDHPMDRVRQKGLVEPCGVPRHRDVVLGIGRSATALSDRPVAALTDAALI